jgi:site-specific DNA recombinase
MRAVIYSRVSSREQEQEGYSIPAQLRMLKEYASRNGFVIEREFVDVETAKTTGRKSFGEMVDFLRGSRNCRVVLVEKTDRLYRNFRDYVTLEELDLDIHLVKENEIISKDSRSNAKFMHGIRLVMAKNYSDNLREEVTKGMREKAEQGLYPARAPFGYRNGKSNRSIEVDSDKAPILKRIFELYATGNHSLSSLRKALTTETGVNLSRAYLEKLLKNRFYIGYFVWRGTEYKGIHPPLIDPATFQRVQDVFSGHHKPKYRKHDFAFAGLMTCVHDGCTVTTELHKGKYVYYRCSQGRGKCELPYMRESDVSDRMGQLLKDIYVPEAVVKSIVHSLQSDLGRSEMMRQEQLTGTKQRLAAIRTRMDQMYEDKLDRKIDESFWSRKMSEWRAQEQALEIELSRLSTPIEPERVLNAARILELANRAYFLYLTRNHQERGELLKKVLLNCGTDGVSLTPTYRKPFDSIFQRAKNEEWSGRLDSNQRPPAPKAGALPGCATPRLFRL